MEKTVTASVLTDIGMRRERNDDAVCSAPEANFYAVADGIGQMALGGLTAEETCRMMSVRAESIYQDYKVHGDEQKASEDLKKALTEISNDIFRKGNDQEFYRYGCTFCGAMIFEKKLAIVNIGDSRAYVKSRNSEELLQITEDHNLAASAAKNGYMTYEEAVRCGLASRLLNFVGISDSTEVDLFLMDRDNVETILLCSDGLSGMAADKDIAVCIGNHQDPEQICRELICMANQNGGKDNISAAVIKLT